MIPVDEFMRLGEGKRRGRFGDNEETPNQRFLAPRDHLAEYRITRAEIEDDVKPTGEGQG